MAWIGGVAQGVGLGLQAYGQWDSSRRAARQSELDRRQQLAMFERTQTQTIQDRVADARRAGIGPLAAMGMQGSTPPSISARRGGTYSPATGVGKAVQGIGRYIERQQQQGAIQLQNETINSQRAETEKRRAETDAVRIQTELAKQRYYERQQGLHGPSVASEAEAYPLKDEPAYVRYTDPRTGEVWWGPSERYVESMEGTAGLGYHAREQLKRSIESFFAPKRTRTPGPGPFWRE